jgi:endoglucanase
MGKVLDASDFRRIHDAGFKTVRIPVGWYNHSSKDAPHKIDPVFLARVTTVVDLALAAHLNVILDSHNFQLVHDKPAEAAPWLAEIWRQVAANFASRPNSRLWFEIENEPHNQLKNTNLLQTFAPALAAIRTTNPTRPVIIGGENWSGIDSLATLELPDDAQVYPTFHYYEPFAFTHQGASWVAPNVPPVGRKYGSAADKALLVTDQAKVAAYTARTGKVPFIGETGAYEAFIPVEQRVSYYRAIHDAFMPMGIGICAWAYTNTFPFWDHKTERWLPGLRGAFGLSEATK